MHVEETFAIRRAPDVVFDYVASPNNLPIWQTSVISVEQLSDGPPGLGSRFRERTKPRVGRSFGQIVEFTEFDPPRASTHTSSKAYTRSTGHGLSRRTTRAPWCISLPKANSQG